MEKTVVLGVNWSVEVWDARHVLESLAIPYEYHNIDDNPDAYSRVKNLCDGEIRIPTLVLPNGRVLIEPTPSEITALFDRRFASAKRDTQPVHSEQQLFLEPDLDIGNIR